MERKVYFAASIRGGRDHASKYQAIVDQIKLHATVLTEHFSDMSLTQKGTHSDNNHIYETDMNWIKEADLIVAEVSQPSLGVGYELRYAQELEKKVLCLYEIQEEKKLSAMISGANYFTIQKYKNIDQAKQYIDDFLEEYA